MTEAQDARFESVEQVQQAEQRFDRSPWGFVVAIDTLRGQGPIGYGFLLNERAALTSAAVVADLSAVAVRGISTDVTSKAEVIPVVSLGEIGGLAVLRLLDPPGAELPPGFGQAHPGDAFTMPAVDADGRLTTVEGLVGRSGDTELLLERTGGVRTGQAAAGLPVLVGGLVAGVVVFADADGGPHAVALTEAAGQLAEWAPEVRDAVWPVGGAPASYHESAFSRGAWRALSRYDAVAAANDPALPAETALWGALVEDSRNYPTTLAAVVARHLEAQQTRPDLSALGVPVAPSSEPPTEAPDPSRLVALSAVLDAAAGLRDRTSPGDTVHRRHLVVALFLQHPEPLVAAGAAMDRLREELLAALGDHWPDDDQAAWREALTGATPTAPTARARQRAGYHADVVGAPGSLTDELHVRSDVNTLCDVLAAKDALPPISVGLFGRWGTGKSYFMALMQERLAKLAQEAAKRPDQTAYCSDIAQITFNAWHYMDANLWASLAVRIFEGLSAADRDEAADEAGRLLDELNQRERQLATIDQKIGRALDDERFKAAAADAGLESARIELLALTGDVTRFRGLVRAAWTALVRPGLWSAQRRRAVRWALLTVVAVLAASAVVAVSMGGLTGVTRGLVAAGPPLALAIAFAARQVRRVHDGLRAANEVLTRFGLEPADVAASRADQDPEIRRIKQRLAELDRRRGLYDFVLERAGSDDYRRHFGLISVVRGDLEKLAGHLASSPSPPRIVLYIDDLDRCPPAQVVEVLQAVHLLLAFPLFVVVVGVDPRWLLRSLERHYEEVLSPDGEAGAHHPGDETDEELFWESTPQNYLEKIFQIPFALRPMGPEGFGRLVEKLLAPAATAPGTPGGASGGERETATPVPSDGDRPAPPAGDARSTSGEGRQPAPVGSPGSAASVGSAGTHVTRDAAAPADEIDPNPTALAVSADEVAFIGSLGGLVATPREAKRLVNVYRLVRASLPSEQVDEFVAERSYEPLLTLLAVLVGYPHEARSLFRALHTVDSTEGLDIDGSWRGLVRSLRPERATPGDPYSSWVDARMTDAEVDRWAVIIAALLDMPEELSDDLAVFRACVEVVERYSFDTALAGVVRPARPTPPAA